MIYSPLGEYGGTTTKFGPMAKSEAYTSVSCLLDKIFNHLALVGSGAAVVGDVESKLDAIAVVVVMEEDVLMLDGIWFEKPLEIVYMHLSSLELPPFGCPPDVLCHHL